MGSEGFGVSPSMKATPASTAQPSSTARKTGALEELTLCYEQLYMYLNSTSSPLLSHQGAGIYRNTFADFPHAEGTPPTMHWSRVHAYIEQYADTKGLKPHLQLGTTVCAARPEAGGERWAVSTQAAGAATPTTEYFDAVIVRHCLSLTLHCLFTAFLDLALLPFTAFRSALATIPSQTCRTSRALAPSRAIRAVGCTANTSISDALLSLACHMRTNWTRAARRIETLAHYM